MEAQAFDDAASTNAPGADAAIATAAEPRGPKLSSTPSPTNQICALLEMEDDTLQRTDTCSTEKSCQSFWGWGRGSFMTLPTVAGVSGSLIKSVTTSVQMVMKSGPIGRVSI